MATRKGSTLVLVSTKVRQDDRAHIYIVSGTAGGFHSVAMNGVHYMCQYAAFLPPSCYRLKTEDPQR